MNSDNEQQKHTIIEVKGIKSLKVQKLWISPSFVNHDSYSFLFFFFNNSNNAKNGSNDNDEGFLK